MSYPGDQDLSDFSMLDLFRSEVETHTETLSEGLLELEENPEAKENIESLMRAAHSIKGGARIVELDAAVRIAHSMEDCFVAVQKNEISLNSNHVDTLLQGVDLLGQLSGISDDNIADWIETHADGINRLVDDISAILRSPEPEPDSIGLTKIEDEPDEIDDDEIVLTPISEDASEPPLEIVMDLNSDSDALSDNLQLEEKPEETPEKQELERVPGNACPVQVIPEELTEETREVIPSDKNEVTSPKAEKTVEKDRMLRVKTEKIERFMGLAGEVMVNARWLPPFYKSLVELKKKQAEILFEIQRLEDMIERGEDRSRIQHFISSTREKIRDGDQYLADRMMRLEMFTTSSELLSDRLYHEIISVRMCPFSDGVKGFPRMIRDLARELGKKIKLRIIGESTEVDRDIMEKLEAPLTHLIRNAADHGIESPEERIALGKPEIGTIIMEAAHRSGILMITISDDGRGIQMDELREKVLKKVLTNEEMVNKLSESELVEFLFLPGFSTVDQITDISGRGVGLDVVHNMVHEVGGVVRAYPTEGNGLTFQMELPLTLSVIRTFIVQIAGEPYAFPLARIDHCLKLPRSKIEIVEDRQYFQFDRNISIVNVHDILGLEPMTDDRDELPVVIVSDRMHAYGLVVDQFMGECDLVVRPLDRRLGKIRDISASAIMMDGAPVLLFDVDDLVRSIDNFLTGKQSLRKIEKEKDVKKQKQKKRVLVVDDSVTVREMERKILENRGYAVDTAVDGRDGWNHLRTGNYQMIITDIDMPRMNGIELIDHIKQQEEYRSLPVVVVSYKNKKEDRLKGLEAGANYYLTKSSFQDNSFIDAVIDLIGEA